MTDALFSTLAWSILEPNYSDTVHVKARVTGVESLNEGDPFGDVQPEDVGVGLSFAKIVDQNDQEGGEDSGTSVLISPQAVFINSDGGHTKLIPAKLDPAKEYGVHLQEGGGIGVLVAVEETPGRGAFDTVESAVQTSGAISLCLLRLPPLSAWGLVPPMA
ncbi:MAG: hypothetical protein R3C05_30730 [Pirellulaceae bacterium]